MPGTTMRFVLNTHLVRPHESHFKIDRNNRLASLQTSFVTLDEALKVTNRRVNALENVTIPKIQGVLDYIARELDELEREGKLQPACLFLVCLT